MTARGHQASALQESYGRFLCGSHFATEHLQVDSGTRSHDRCGRKDRTPACRCASIDGASRDYENSLKHFGVLERAYLVNESSVGAFHLAEHQTGHSYPWQPGVHG